MSIVAIQKENSVEILYNPYQGLKHGTLYLILVNYIVEILYNPYQGLKLPLLN